MRCLSFLARSAIAFAILVAPASADTTGRAALGLAAGAVQGDTNGRVPVARSYAPESFLVPIGANYSIAGSANNYSTTTSYFETTRIVKTAKGPISRIQLFMNGKTGLNGQEVNRGGIGFHKATIEYPISTSNTQPALFSLNGQTVMAVDPASTGALSDPMGVNIPAGAQFAVRYSTGIAWPPASIAAAASAGGSLAQSTTYYYKGTCTIKGAESGPTAEASVATTTTNLTTTVTFTATVSPLGCDSIKVYRATTSGGELYLGTIPGPGLTFVDTGILPTVAGASPPAAPTYAFAEHLGPNHWTTGKPCGGAQQDLTVGTGTISPAGPQSCFVDAPIVLADDVGSKSVCGLNDSIGAGSGIGGNQILLGFSTENSNFFNKALPEGSYNTLNLSMPSGQVSSLVSQAFYGASQRLRQLDFCGIIYNNQGTNDFAAGLTWQQVAGWQVQLGTWAHNRGKLYFIGTILPRGASTNNMISNFTPNATAEAQRPNYNTWIRNGMQMSGSTPVLSGGTPTTAIDGGYDAASALPEVNAAGVPTLNGGYWPPAVLTLSGQALTGTPTSTSLPVGSASYTPHTYAGYAVQITSGAANGATCVISDNTATSLTCTAALSGTPSAGDTLAIYQTTSLEGIHPTLLDHTTIATGGSTPSAGFAAYAAAHFQ